MPARRRVDRHRNLKPFGWLEQWELSRGGNGREMVSIWEPMATFSDRWALFGGPVMDQWAARDRRSPDELDRLLGEPVWVGERAPWPVARFGLPDGWRAEGASDRFEAARVAHRLATNRAVSGVDGDGWWDDGEA